MEGPWQGEMSRHHDPFASVMGRAASDRLKIGSALERAAAQREGGFFSELLADLTCFGSASTDLRPKVCPCFPH